MAGSLGLNNLPQYSGPLRDRSNSPSTHSRGYRTVELVPRFGCLARQSIVDANLQHSICRDRDRLLRGCRVCSSYGCHCACRGRELLSLGSIRVDERCSTSLCSAGRHHKVVDDGLIPKAESVESGGRRPHPESTSNEPDVMMDSNSPFTRRLLKSKNIGMMPAKARLNRELSDYAAAV